MTKFIASAGRGRLGRHPLPLALAAALMLAEPCAGRAEGESPLLLARADHAGAHFSALLGLRGSGALKERHQRIPDRPASTIVVANCNDNGSGSLRDALATAVNGDIIDLTQLVCSTITLASGGIITSLDEIELVGPGADALTIDAAYHGRAIYHLGDGTLEISGLTITRGTYSGGTYYRSVGGCVFSRGNVDLTDAVVSHCNVTDAFTDAYGPAGGCVMARGNVVLTDTSISACTATSTSEDVAAGGGVFAEGSLTLLRSTLSGNSASSEVAPAHGGGAIAVEDLVMKYSTVRDNTAGPLAGLGGGIHAQGDAYLIASTVAGNHASAAGGLWLTGDTAQSPAIIRNSTISGNSAETSTGGVIVGFALKLANSTIAFNTCAALNVSGLYIAEDSEFQSSIIANNSAGSVQRDLGGDEFAVITGANNLIEVTFLSPPGDTLTIDPMLGPLANNGGRTRTHALLPGSPALDAGNNAYDLTRDQRGSGFEREIGASADIGAFESDPGRIFTNGFEG